MNLFFKAIDKHSEVQCQFETNKIESLFPSLCWTAGIVDGRGKWTKVEFPIVVDWLRNISGKRGSPGSCVNDGSVPKMEYAATAHGNQCPWFACCRPFFIRHIIFLSNFSAPTQVKMAWVPEESGLGQILQLLKESQSPDNATQRAVQQVKIGPFLIHAFRVSPCVGQRRRLRLCPCVWWWITGLH